MIRAAIQAFGRAAFLTLAAALSASAAADRYSLRVVAGDLQAPTGIAIRGNNTIYFTEVPTPGVPGSQGGANGVKRLRLHSGRIDTLNMGEPEPLHLALARDGSLYWTCRSAGVILERSPSGTVTPFLTNLAKPTGIGIPRSGDVVYFTQVPTPGLPGTMGGTNTVNRLVDGTIETLTMGEPEPTDIVVTRQGAAFWTCKSAGVILTRDPYGAVSLFLGGLNKPVGIALDFHERRLFFTEVPTPGVPGAQGGGNFVWEVDLATKARSIVNFGDPDPRDVAVARNGRVYWTCTSAGVIVEARPNGRGELVDDEGPEAEALADDAGLASAPALP